MEPGKRTSNCWAREVAEARWPPPVSEERKRTRRDFLLGVEVVFVVLAAVVSVVGSVLLVFLPSSLPLHSDRE